jgi:hypothetical protein
MNSWGVPLVEAICKNKAKTAISRGRNASNVSNGVSLQQDQEIMWQEIITGIVVAGAVAFLIKRFFLNGNSNSGCNKCAPGKAPGEFNKKT